jgi:hypothetical protein
MAVGRRHRVTTPSPAPVRPPPRRLPPRGTRRIPERRVLLFGLLISAVLHAALFILSPAIVLVRDRESPDAGRTPATPPPPRQAMHVVEIRPVTAGADAPPSVARPVVPPRALPPGAGPVAPVSPPQPGAPLAHRLRPPQSGDPRIWAPVPDLPPEMLAPGRILLERVRAALADTAATPADRPELFADWTFVDARGRRWGIADGMLYLGDIAIPLPIAFSLPPGRREELRDRLREWEAIQAQAAREEVRAATEARARAIRERRDRERAERDGDP